MDLKAQRRWMKKNHLKGNTSLKGRKGGKKKIVSLKPTMRML